MDQLLYFRLAARLAVKAGANADNIYLWTTVILLTASLLVAAILYWVLAGPITKLINRITLVTANIWDDSLLSTKMLRSFSMIVVTTLAALIIPHFCALFPTLKKVMVIVLNITLTTAVAYTLNKFILILYRLMHKENPGMHGLAAVRNLLSTLIWGVAGLLIISIITQKNISIILSGLGAMAAVSMLIFKDSILGMVAGIKLSFNKMLKPGDWIKMEKYNANGIVVDVTLTAVKVKNWDMSISTVPPYSLLSEGFTNMEAMKITGGRRITKTILIDTESIRLLQPHELEEYAAEDWAKDTDLTKPVVNLTLLRRWLMHYLRHFPTAIEKDNMFTMVRELDSTPQGIPLEIYLFTTETRWDRFEAVQSDLMDGIYASVRQFRLRLFSAPGAVDIRALSPVRSAN